MFWWIKYFQQKNYQYLAIQSIKRKHYLYDQRIKHYIFQYYHLFQSFGLFSSNSFFNLLYKRNSLIKCVITPSKRLFDDYSLSTDETIQSIIFSPNNPRYFLTKISHQIQKTSILVSPAVSVPIFSPQQSKTSLIIPFLIQIRFLCHYLTLCVLYLNYQNQAIAYLEPMMENEPSQLQMMKKMENYIFNLNDKLGQGSFSQVFRGLNVLTNQQVAVKKIRIGDIKSKIARRLLECEINILRMMDHPHIIKCFDVHSSIHNCYIITQICQQGDLDQHLRKHPLFPLDSFEKIIYSVYQALQYLSNLGIIHRDLKVSNIFIQQDTYKLGDFGFAIKANKIFKDVAIGSPIYMSPEGLIYNLYGPKTDVWSFGILIYELIHGTTPLASCKSEAQLRDKVLETPKITKEISLQLRQLMENCLKVSEKERYSIAEIGKCAFIRNLRQQFKSKMNFQQDLTLTRVSTSTTLTLQSSMTL